jgi:eukaryotic-like serine/threonine-protein kinase
MDAGLEGGTRREATPVGDGSTRREEGMPPGNGTRREGAPAAFAGTRHEGAAGTGGRTRLEDAFGTGPAGRSSSGGFVRGLPPELSAQFTVVNELAAGAEADVVVADEVTSGRRLVIKLYRRGVVPDEEAVARLAAADHAHVVEIVSRGWAGGCWCEVLEYCPDGSLRTLMDASTAPSVTDVVRETGSALQHVHGLSLVHRDLKPENILIRTVSPLDVVLGDFGLVRTLDTSVRWTRAWGTPAYSPPEFDGGEVSAGWDWWSLGMIVAELAGGRHPFQLPDGSMMSDQQIRAALAQRAVDLSAVNDNRARLLCQGLLTRDRRHRWNYQQVTEWLAGGSPRIVADVAATPAGRTRRVFFLGREYDSPAALAQGLQQRWLDGMRQLFQERDANLADELERMLRAHHLEEALRLIGPQSGATKLPRRYATLLAEMDPQLEPVYNGLRIAPDGLEAAAMQIIRANGNHQATRILDEVRDMDILMVWRDLPGMEDGPSIQQAWAAADSDLTSEIEQLRAHGYQPTEAETAYARAWLLLCVLAPSHRDEIGNLVADLDPREAGRQQWWRDLRDRPRPTPASLVLTRLTHSVAIQQTHRQDEAENARLRAEEQRRADEADQQRQQRRAERERRLAGRRGTDRAFIYTALVLIVTFGLPYGLGVWWLKQHDHATVAPPPDPRALPTGAAFLPQWAFGALVIVGLLGLIFLRPPWPGRTARILAGLLLIGAGAAAPSAANAALTAFNRAGQHSYATGPIPVSALGQTCDSYWTSDGPVGDGGFMRWALTDSNGDNCTALVAFQGWHQVWHVATTSNSWWENLHMYGDVIVAERDTGSAPNVLDGINHSNGHLLWVFSCGDGDDSYLSDTSYGSSTITVTCARGQVTVDPSTGKQTS